MNRERALQFELTVTHQEGRCSINPYGIWYQMAHTCTQLSGPAVTLSNATVGNLGFTVPADAAEGTTLEFRLTVTDREGESDSDTVIETIAAAEPIRPTANAGPDLTQRGGVVLPAIDAGPRCLPPTGSMMILRQGCPDPRRQLRSRGGTPAVPRLRGPVGCVAGIPDNRGQKLIRAYRKGLESNIHLMPVLYTSVAVAGVPELKR